MNSLTGPDTTPIALELNLSGKSVEDLHHDLRDAIGMTAKSIQRVAAIWAELELRGEDLSDIKFSLAKFMPMVASGNLLPEVVTLLAGQVRSLAAVSALDLNDQQRLVDGGLVEIATQTGAVIKKMVTDMSLSEVLAVIRDGQIRNIPEQRLSLKRLKTRHKSRSGRPPKIVINADSGEISVGKYNIPLDRLLAQLRAAGLLGT